MANEFSATARADGDAAVIDLSGDVNRDARAGLEAAYHEAAATSDTVVLNFDQTDYINSTGIAVIVGVLAHARASGKTVRAYGLTSHYQEIFQITRLADFIGIYDNELAAVAAAN